MNTLTSLQRKAIYVGGIILLIIPVIFLGMPAAPAGSGNASGSAGGLLVRLRAANDLGESSLGKVDPASATMNLVLLGQRGLAACLLWMDWDEQQKTKNWGKLRSTTESIILLEPHFTKVWVHQGWNLAFNVSAEWDRVDDRYYWVKEGAKFLQNGVLLNERYPELYWYSGDFLGKKIGRSDEWKQFRHFFRDDPDKEHYPSGLDPRINPEGKDNYLVARGWFKQANDWLDNPRGKEQHVMAKILFRSYPTRALLDFASTLQREGIFEEVCRKAWEDAFQEWTTVYGAEKYESDAGLVHLEVSREEEADLTKAEKDISDVRKKISFWVGRYQDMTNYRYWRTRALAEGEQNTVEAHRELYTGERAYLQGNFTEAKQLLVSGMTKYEKMVNDYPPLADDDETIEEGLMGQLNWRACLLLDQEPVPETYPLKKMWTEKQSHMQRVEDDFKRRRRNASR